MTATGESIIKAVRSIAAERPSHAYAQADGCAYVLNGKPACLIGHALWNLGLLGPSIEDLRWNIMGIDSLLDDKLDIPVGSEEMGWLSLVQEHQDMGLPWGEAVEMADGTKL